jgi:hypothetical protein
MILTRASFPYPNESASFASALAGTSWPQPGRPGTRRSSAPFLPDWSAPRREQQPGGIGQVRRDPIAVAAFDDLVWYITATGG